MRRGVCVADLVGGHCAQRTEGLALQRALQQARRGGIERTPVRLQALPPDQQVVRVGLRLREFEGIATAAVASGRTGTR